MHVRRTSVRQDRGVLGYDRVLWWRRRGWGPKGEKRLPYNAIPCQRYELRLLRTKRLCKKSQRDWQLRQHGHPSGKLN